MKTHPPLRFGGPGHSGGLAGRAVRATRAGFTLIETALTMVIIGVAVMAILELLSAGSMSNLASSEMTAAVNLAGNVREIALGLEFRDPQEDPMKPELSQWDTKEAAVKDYDDIKDLDGANFKPPLDARREPIGGYGDWAQVVSVQTVATDYLESLRPRDPTAQAARVTVTVTHHGKQVHTASWVAMGKKKPKA